MFQTFKHSVDYATEVKMYAQETHGPRRYSPVKCISARRTAMIGEPDLKFASTAHAERTNLSVRIFNRRFTRLTLGYSKKLQNHKHAVALFVAHFNFCRSHSALKLRATDLVRAEQQTPAMAANLTAHVWTVEELLNAK